MNLSILTRILSFLICVLINSHFVDAQRISFGYGGSLTTVNPQENFGLDQSSRVWNSFGTEWAFGYHHQVTEKVRMSGFLTGNSQSVRINYRFRADQQTEYQLDGNMEADYLGLSLLPEIVNGERIQFFYGGGVYIGALVSGSFSGREQVIVDGKSTAFQRSEWETDTYRNLVWALVPKLGFQVPFGRFAARTDIDLLLFQGAKNLIFADTGSVNEINFRLSLCYLLEKPEE